MTVVRGFGLPIPANGLRRISFIGIPQSVPVPPVSAALPCNLPFSSPDSGYRFRCKRDLGLRWIENTLYPKPGKG